MNYYVKEGIAWGHLIFDEDRFDQPFSLVCEGIDYRYSKEDHFSKIPVESLNGALHCKTIKRLKRVIAKAIMEVSIFGDRGRLEFAKGFLRDEDWWKVKEVLERRINKAILSKIYYVKEERNN